MGNDNNVFPFQKRIGHTFFYVCSLARPSFFHSFVRIAVGQATRQRCKQPRSVCSLRCCFEAVERTEFMYIVIVVICWALWILYDSLVDFFLFFHAFGCFLWRAKIERISNCLWRFLSVFSRCWSCYFFENILISNIDLALDNIGYDLSTMHTHTHKSTLDIKLNKKKRKREKRNFQTNFTQLLCEHCDF